MKTSGEFSVTRPVSEIIAYIGDPAQFARCFPDYEDVRITDQAHFTVSLAVSFGASNGCLDLHLERMDGQPPHSVHYIGSGVAARNDIRFDLIFHVGPEGESTRVEWSGEFAVEGMFALFAGPMIERLGERNLRQLAVNLQSGLDTPDVSTHSQL